MAVLVSNTLELIVLITADCAYSVPGDGGCDALAACMFTTSVKRIAWTRRVRSQCQLSVQQLGP